MNNTLEAKYYFWNSFCERLCIEKLSLKSVKVNDNSISNLQLLTNTYSNCIAKSFKILTIYSELLELEQDSRLNQETLNSKIRAVDDLHAEIKSLIKQAQFIELRKIYLPKTENNDILL